MFGKRGKRGRHHVSKDSGRLGVPDYDAVDESVDENESTAGPFDEHDAPQDGLSRLDLGSVRVPVPDGAQLQVEVDPSGPVRAVHLVTPIGQITVSAYAAPRGGGLWPEICEELVTQLRGDGARVIKEAGEWGTELAATANNVVLRFIGVDGPRWMLRGVVAGPGEHNVVASDLLRTVVRGTVVVRGVEPQPVRTPLPVELPPAIAQHIQAQQQG
ncbi:DUF3710 domain-containing protein [Kutzneria sp. NPDC051319]|uniref:DUF3710 domain-containing protein n=1 Tax=Kutzneria sp. NPDC051319 TaxID=3155047 RepID=UPI003414B7DF